MTIHLPTLNAILNLTAFICLFCGWRAIKQGKPDIHRKWMIRALFASTFFLISYITHHLLHGSTHYTHQGILRIIYFTILITHTPLAAIIVPLAIAAVYFALKKDFTRHTRITRVLYPIWAYVSITGVIIYLMLYIF